MEKENRPMLYLIGNAHLDPVWLWKWGEGFTEILSTFRSALDRMKEFPEFKFTCACAVYYEWVRKMDPEMFEEIRERVKEGRWNIVGGWYLQPDCNIPDGESFARHGLISQRFFMKEFGVRAKTGYNVDSFGHNASLPQILKKSGMDAYVFMRPSPEEQGRDEQVFLWESPDGTRIPAYRIPYFYNIDRSRIHLFRELKEKAEKTDTGLMAFYGIGNHGGGPTIKLLQAMRALDFDGMAYGTPDEFFQALDPSVLPVIKDELQHHARGCYSVNSFVKMSNRRCEHNLLAAEKLSSMAEYLTGFPYPKKRFDKGWKNVLFNQFHDIMGGCCIREAYQDAGYLFGETMSITEQAITQAMTAISRRIDTLQGKKLPSEKEESAYGWHVWETDSLGTPAVVFNPHGFAVKMPVVINTCAASVTDEKGQAVPFQIIRGSQTNGGEDKYSTLFMAETDPMGYRVYRFFPGKPDPESGNGTLRITERCLENEKLRVEFSGTTGDISRILWKENGQELLNGECRAILLDETDCDTWAHNRASLGDIAGVFSEPEFRVTEEGPVRVSLQVRTFYGASVLQRTYSLVTGADRLSVSVRVDFREKHRTLKFTFPTVSDRTLAKIPYGTIERANDLGEEPCGSFLAAGPLLVTNDGKYGYDTCGGELRMTVLRSAIYADHYGVRDDSCVFMEQGIHECAYEILPYRNPAAAERAAEELNFPLRVMMDSFHGGELPERGSCLGGNTGDALIIAVKKAEDGDGTVLRLLEMNGTDSGFSFDLFGHSYRGTLAHHEIRTLREDGKTLNLLEETAEADLSE